jgi:N-acetylmuramoyl-L-alanine amidase
MKNTYMKTLAVACVATFVFIGQNNSSVEAHTETPVVQVDSLLDLGEEYGIAIDDKKPDINIHEDWIYIGGMLQIPDNSKVLAIQSSEPATETPEKELEEPAVSISNEEKDLFVRLVEAEAKGESYEGKVAVATVVLNRVDSPEFPDTITDVIKEVVGTSYAFSPVQNGEINKPASDEAVRAVDEALTRKDRLNDCIYFYNPEIATDDWIRTRTVVKTIGNHVFAI